MSATGRDAVLSEKCATKGEDREEGASLLMREKPLPLEKQLT